MNLVFTLALWFLAIGCGLIAGLYFAFSTFIMTALGRAGVEVGAVAMNAINATILRSLFMPLFYGTSLCSLVIVVLGASRWGGASSAWSMAGGAVYIVGMTVVTIAFNVPLNNALAATVSDPNTGVEIWNRYLADWTRWNHVRTAASTLASAFFIAAIASNV